jgi:hypothetical protein
MHIESVIEEGGKSRSAEIGPLNTPADLERQAPLAEQSHERRYEKWTVSLKNTPHELV